MENILKEAYIYAKKFTKYGKLVDYIPELGKVDKSNLGISIIDGDNKFYDIGDTKEKFTIMSIVKVILYLMALENYDYSEILNYIDVKCSSKPYNSLIELELSENKKPVNPFVNAGALVTTYLLYKKFKEETVFKILNKSRELMNNSKIQYSEQIVKSAIKKADTNFAIGYTLKKNGIIPKNVDLYKILEIYCISCCIMINTKDLVYFSSILTRNGKNLENKQIINIEHARILKSLMAICGTYDYSGEFSIKVGLPAKSGVGGGFIATTNKNISISTYSPALDERGNPLASIKFLEYLSKSLDLSIY